jgi:hypothetical protein
VERSQDLKRKFPLLVAGDLPFPGLEIEQQLNLSGQNHASWAELFVCLSASENKLAEILSEAAALEIPFSQMILYVSHYPSSVAIPSGLTVIEAHSGESPEDLRLRLACKIESLRQQRLNHELALCEKNPALGALSETERQSIYEHARIAHALAYLYEFTPSRHTLCIRLAFCARHPELRENMLAGFAVPAEHFPSAENSPWQPTLPFEMIIALCTTLTLSCCENPAQFREAFRTRSALLPFKVRNDLKTQVEKILEPLWGGKNAA